MDLIEDFLEYVVQRVIKNMKPELEILGRDISKLEKEQSLLVLELENEIVIMQFIFEQIHTRQRFYRSNIYLYTTFSNNFINIIFSPNLRIRMFQ